jgi:HD-GYP domain-containing protein (c-di-GMP phosphodiesterase class II)
MSGNGHRQTYNIEGLEKRARTSTRRVDRSGAAPHRFGKWLWAVGAVIIVASITVLLMGQEPTLFNYLATSALLGSMGLLALVSASRALNVGARYEETILHVEEVERSYHSLRQVVTSAMDLRDNVTGGHSDRVVHLSLELGRGLGLTDDRLQQLEWAAFLHDIGKIHVHEEILTKPGPLDEVEWGEMRQHAFFSYSILTQVDELSEIAELVYCHHERYDGKGYPRCLRGSEIPLAARIFSVADAYDAMVSQRPYRAPLSHEYAVREIISNAGTQFDPQIVAEFARWAISTGDDGIGRMVEDEVERLPAGLPQLDRANWA